MKLPNKVYDVMKWLICIVSPAFIAMFPKVCETWSWNIPVDGIITTVSAVTAFLGIILGISTLNYNDDQRDGKL